MTRARIRCLSMSGTSKDGQRFDMRVQTVDGEVLSTEGMKALLRIAAAAYEQLAGMPDQTAGIEKAKALRARAKGKRQ